MLLFCPLASGSKGNAYLLKTAETTLLLDCGISVKELRKRLQFLGVELSDIDAVLITHEHRDHILGLKALAKSNIPVFTNKETAKGIYQAIQVKPKLKIFATNEGFTFQDVAIFPFSVQHDTLDPVGFCFEVEGKKIGICTDLGKASSFLQKKLQQADILVVEANHDPAKVEFSKRPLIYKRRVLSDRGHLSNAQCAQLLSCIAHEELQVVYLSHLSQECNTPQLAKEVVLEKNPELASRILIATQEKVSEPISL